MFFSDLIFDVFHLPTEIYIHWKSNYPTCFEIKLKEFFRTFPLFMSGSILSVISIDRYINVVHDRFHAQFVTKMVLTTTVVLVTLVSIMWGILETLFSLDLEKTKIRKFYIPLSVYMGILLATIVVFNVALLRNVKQKTKNSSLQQSVSSSLTKTIAIVTATGVITYLPSIITITIFVYTNSNDKNLTKMLHDILTWTSILPRINAALNSIIYLARSSRMRRYYYKLLNCKSTKIHLQRPVGPVQNVRRQVPPAS